MVKRHSNANRARFLSLSPDRCILKTMQPLNAADIVPLLPTTQCLAWVHEPPTLSQQQSRFIQAFREICVLRKNELPRNPLLNLLRNSNQWLFFACDSDGSRGAARAVLADWAKKCALISADGTQLEWIIDWGEDYLIRVFMGEKRIILSRNLSTAITTPPPPPPGFAGSLSLPIPKRGQLGDWTRDLELKVKQAKKLAKSYSAKPVKRKSGTYQFLHYEFLVLRICGMTWPQISELYSESSYQTGPETAKMGARSCAGRLGIRWPIPQHSKK